MKLQPTAFASVCAGLLLATVGMTAEYAPCEGVATHFYLNGVHHWYLHCMNPCPEGCDLAEVITPNGPGSMCQCNYVGPHPDCCALVVVGNDLFTGLTTTGACDAPGCSLSGACHVASVPDGRGAVCGFQ